MAFIFIGVTLDKGKNTEVWDPDVKPDANDSSHVFRGEHTLLVKQVNKKKKKSYIYSCYNII